jgi:hypothetical protein
MAVEDIIKQGRHHKHVKLFVPFESREALMANAPPGFLLTLYAPPHDPNQFTDQNVVNLTVVVNENEPEPKYRRYKDDIDTYLAHINTIDSRIRILSDTVTKKEQPDLVEDWFLKNEVVLNHPGLDGEMDHLRSKAANVKEIEVDQSHLVGMEAQYDKAKGEYIRTKLTDAVDTGKTDKVTGQKIFKVQQGEI